MTLGQAGSIQVQRNDPEYTHRISYQIGDAGGTVCEKTGETRISWTPPLSLAEEMPDAVAGDCVLTDQIRLPEMSRYASTVSAIPAVRDFLLELQREQARCHSVIMDGRDIGTVVLPDATVKIFLTAAPEVRAMRRFRELEQRGTSQPYDQVLREIVDRDYADTHRAIAPLRRAEDAVELDTGALTFEESLHLLLETIRRRAKL